MFKQIIIIFVVIVFVISLDVISNNYLEKAVDELSKELTDLKETSFANHAGKSFKLGDSYAYIYMQQQKMHLNQQGKKMK